MKNTEQRGKKKEGIVAYFDILGYQNFLQNNKIEYCIEVIEEIILKLPEETKNERFGFYIGNDVTMNSIKKYFETEFVKTFLSDTILFFFDFDFVDSYKKPLLFHQILFYLLFFMRKTFEAGFPMRGYIDYGEYYYKNSDDINIIAGKTIVKCHNEANDLNFSGLVISNELVENYYEKYKKEIIENTFDEKNLIARDRFMTIYDYKIIDKYIVNLKNVEMEKYVVNFLIDFQKTDITQYIFESFHMHNKKINNFVMEKTRNTEKLFRCFIHNNSMLFP